MEETTSGDCKHEKNQQEPTSDYTADDTYYYESDFTYYESDFSEFNYLDDVDFNPNMIYMNDADLFHQKHMWPYAQKLLSCMKVDDSEEFLKTLKHEVYTAHVRTHSGYEISPLLILSAAIAHRAIRCAKMLLSGVIGEATDGYPIDLNRVESPDTSLPIQRAATEFLPDFASLFLTYGARLDIPCDTVLCKYRSMLPMDAGLKALSEKISWTPAQSVYDLISSLCNKMELEQGLLTMSHIMTAAPVEHTRKVICNYAGEGKTLELAMLLYVDAISGLGIFKSFSYDEYLELCTRAATNITSLPEEEELYLAIDGNGATKSMDELRMAMTSVLLLEIFYKTNFSMIGFSTGHEILAKKINDAGLDLDDDVQAMKRVVKCLKSIDVQRLDLLDTRPKWIRDRRAGYPKSDREFYLEKRSISSAAAQTFQGSQNTNSRPMSTLCRPRPMEGQAQVVKEGAQEGWHILNSSLGKTCWPVLASAMRRRIMRV